ncbi:Gfo/Idh/MocA family protein [Salinithrix halophila]|uniref:Gfo/Idh/MocA family protein n=1 Tax=Salinithrix halophila TaxID=1485204 RepID=A0ABV8JF59_9BACL
MDKPIRNIGIIGAGGISEAHLQAAALEPRVRVKAIADLDKKLAQGRGAPYGVKAFYTDYRDMLADETIDAVILCLPNFLHKEAAFAALDADKHVLCEKPLAMNSREAKEMADKAQRAGRLLMPAQNNRFHGDTLLLKRLVEEGKLGALYHAKTGWVRRSGIPGWGSWFTSREKAGGGPLIDVGVHMLDLTLWLMGFPRPVSVFGQTYDRFGPRKKGLSSWGTPNLEGSYDVEDLAVAMIRFENGASLSLDASWASHIREERTFVDLYGEDGGASLDFRQHQLVLYHEEAGVPSDSILHPPKQNERLLLIRNFLDAAEDRSEAVCRPEHGIDVLRVLDAIYESSRTGSLVTLN